MPYKRWSNKKIHRPIRIFIAKSKVFYNTTDRYINYIENWINNNPQRALVYKSSNMIQFI